MNYLCNASRRTGQNAFTSIELLVVIAIIAILAAILFPVFAQAREKARQTACLSNEKQLGLALTQYVQDFDEVYPIGTSGTGGYVSIFGTAGQLYPYIRNVNVFSCPSDPTVASPPNVPLSYSYNQNFGGTDAATYTGRELALLNSPAKTVAYCEVQGYTRNPAQYGMDNSPAGCGALPDSSCYPNPGSTAGYATGYMAGGVGTMGLPLKARRDTTKGAT